MTIYPERVGDRIQCSVAGEVYDTYVPKGLPPIPAINMSDIYPLLDKANVALGRLDGLSAILPDASLFLYMYIRKEAVLSSQIEGTQSSLSDLLLYENQEAPGIPNEDIVEVSNYVAAMEHGLKRLKEGFPLSLRLIREMHEVLLSKGRGSSKQPGEFRRSQNWIGGTRPGNAKFVPVPPEKLMDVLGDLEKFLHNENGYSLALMSVLSEEKQLEKNKIYVDIHNNKIEYKVFYTQDDIKTGSISSVELGKTIPSDITQLTSLLQDILNITLKRGHTRENVVLPILIKAALAHHQFETIHPFLDGNGRLGRLLITFILCAESIMHQPMLYLSLYFKKHRQSYYDHLQLVRETGDWEEWIQFFLQGVVETAHQATETAQAILKIFAEDHVKIEGSKKFYASTLIVHQYMQKHPILEAKNIVEHCHITLPTANKSLKHLTELGIIKEVTGKARNKIYVYQEYLEILNEGAGPLEE